MDRATRRDIVLIGASLLGAAAGYALAPQGRDAKSEGALERQHVTMPAVMAGSGLAIRIGNSLPLEEDESVVRAALAFALAGSIVYLAHRYGRTVPRIAMWMK